MSKKKNMPQQNEKTKKFWEIMEIYGAVTVGMG